MKQILFRILITFLVLQAFFLVSPATAHAEEMTCPPPVLVEIEVKPGDSVTKINLSAKGLLPVAVLSTENFDASLFTPEMAHLGDAATGMGCEGAEAVRWTYTDVNHDGLVDLLFFFRIKDLNLTSSSTEVLLMAHGTYGSTETHIMGTEPVLVKL